MKKSFKNVLALCLVFCMAVGVWGGNTTVRAQETEAKKDYRIMVNRAANCVTVYEKDAQGTYSIPVRVMRRRLAHTKRAALMSGGLWWTVPTVIMPCGSTGGLCSIPYLITQKIRAIWNGISTICWDSRRRLAVCA